MDTLCASLAEHSECTVGQGCGKQFEIDHSLLSTCRRGKRWSVRSSGAESRAKVCVWVTLTSFPHTKAHPRPAECEVLQILLYTVTPSCNITQRLIPEEKGAWTSSDKLVTLCNTPLPKFASRYKMFLPCLVTRPAANYRPLTPPASPHTTSFAGDRNNIWMRHVCSPFPPFNSQTQILNSPMSDVQTPSICHRSPTH